MVGARNKLTICIWGVCVVKAYLVWTIKEVAVKRAKYSARGLWTRNEFFKRDWIYERQQYVNALLFFPRDFVRVHCVPSCVTRSVHTRRDFAAIKNISTYIRYQLLIERFTISLRYGFIKKGNKLLNISHKLSSLYMQLASELFWGNWKRKTLLEQTGTEETARCHDINTSAWWNWAPRLLTRHHRETADVLSNNSLLVMNTSYKDTNKHMWGFQGGTLYRFFVIRGWLTTLPDTLFPNTQSNVSQIQCGLIIQIEATTQAWNNDNIH